MSEYPKPDTAIIELLRGIQTEIGAGMVLFPRSDEDRAHNNACDRANKIIQNYKEGFGLFQMARKHRAAPSNPGTTPSQPEPTKKETL